MTATHQPKIVPDLDEVDALPYIDSLYKGKRKADVDAMIRREMGLFEPKEYLELIPSISFEMNNLDPIDTERYSAPPPPLNMRKNVNAWKHAITNAEAQLQHQSLRMMNLDLMNSHLSKAWIAYSKELKSQQKKLQHFLEECKQQTELVNRSRKEEQVDVKPKLERLERQWYQLVKKNRELEDACRNLESQLESRSQMEQ